LFDARVLSINRINKRVVELIVHAPQAAKKYAPGQFYRLQNFEQDAFLVNNTLLQSEGLACLAAPVEGNANALSFLIFERGASSRLFQWFKQDMPMALMGPSGVRTKIPEAETFMIIGGQMAAAHLRATGPAMKAAGNQVVFVGIFPSSDDVICREALERCCDQIIWVIADHTRLAKLRAGDIQYGGELEAALISYSKVVSAKVPLEKAQEIMIISSPNTLCLIKKLKKDWLDSAVAKKARWYASVYGTMQCMLKGVCAQCLQWQVDPQTGERTKAVYACSWQDQPFEKIDLSNLDERLNQNNMQEQLTNLWLTHVSKEIKHDLSI
jgi:hypothetical protein